MPPTWPAYLRVLGGTINIWRRQSGGPVRVGETTPMRYWNVLHNNIRSAARAPAPHHGLAGLVVSVLTTVAALSFGASVGMAQIVDAPIPEDPIAIDSGAVSGKT